MDFSDILEELNWLPLDHGIKYKTLLLMFKCQIEFASSDQIYKTIYEPGRETLHSSTQRLCNGKPFIDTDNLWELGFSIYGPKLRNMLPLELRAKGLVGSFISLDMVVQRGICPIHYLNFLVL